MSETGSNTIEDVIKELRDENHSFFLSPTKLLQVGANLPTQIPFEFALEQTKEYRNDPNDFFAIFKEHDAIN